LITIAFDADTSIKYSEDQTPNVDSKFTEDVTQDNTILASNVREIDEKKASEKDISSPLKNYAKIHDFCLGIPYGNSFILTPFYSFDLISELTVVCIGSLKLNYAL
jgi:hypothetical protein